MCPQTKHIIISGGGTGGHIFPALAIARELKRRLPEAEYLFIGAKGKMEMEKVPEAGFRIEGLWISGFKRDFSFDNLMFPFKLVSSLAKSWKIQRKFRPDVVVGVGGYASGPALRVAAWHGTPVLIQEQNSFPGITNRLLAKKAKKICVAYPNMDRFFQADKIVLTGNPIRREVVQVEGKRPQAARFFNLDGGRTTVLVIGGSQGARAINEAILADLDFFEIMELQLIWQTGPAYHPKAQQAIDALNCPAIKATPFIKEMDLAYAMADIVVSRAGAIASAELAAVGKPVIFVPLPTAAENHQMKNARSFEAREAAIVVPNDRIKDELPGLLKDLVADKARRDRLSANIRSLAILDATEKICDEIIALIEKR